MRDYKRYEILKKELERLDREYRFAQERAEVHSTGAARGDFRSAMFYSGALSRMEELLQRMMGQKCLTEQDLIDRLSQLRWLRVELGNLQRKVRKLERIVEQRKNLTKKLMEDGENWEEITKFVEPVFEVYLSTRRFACEYLEEYRQLTEFIYGTPDSQMRLILTERYLNGLTWKTIAFRIGEHDEQYPRRLHNHFIAECIRKQNDIHKF